MIEQRTWIERYKLSKCFYSYYRLAKHWNIEQSVLCKLLSGTRKLTLEQSIMIAQELNVEPLEILICVEYTRKNKKLSEYLKGVYFDKAIKTIGDRMFANSGYRKR